MATLIQDTVSEKSSLSSQVEAVGSGLARYGLAVVVAGPALSALPGQFLIKDLALLGISLWTLGEAWQVSEQRG